MTKPLSHPMTFGVSVRVALALAACGLAGCSLVNAIDVCEREAGPTYEVNVRGEGAQAVSGAQPIAALATGGALVVFRSAVAADDDGTGPSSIRVAVLDSQGRPAERTCDAPGENEIMTLSAGIRLDEASVAMPGTTDEEVGLLVFSTRTPAGRTVRGAFVSQTGCLRALSGMSFEIGDVGPSTASLATLPSVAWLGNSTFLVVWTHSVLSPPTGIVSEVRMRVVRASVYEPEFLPTMRDAAGGSAVVLGRSSVTGSGRVDSLGNGRAVVMWNEVTGRLVPYFSVVDDRLATIVAAQAVDSVPSEGVRPPTARGFAAGFDGSHILVTWSLLTEDGTIRVKGRYFDETGASLGLRASPEGAPFVVRDDVTPEDEGRVALTALAGGGFLVGMENIGGRDGRSQTLVARLHGADGGPAFSNLACGAESFSLATSDGDIAEPAVARLVDGSVLVAYTSDGATGSDLSGTGVRATVLAPRVLLPLP